MKKDITELYVFIDDFCKSAKEYMNKQAINSSDSSTGNKVNRIPRLSIAEILTIVLMYQKSPCKNFKYFYQSYLQLYRSEFPRLISYERFVLLKSRSLSYLALLLSWLCSESKKTGISYIDSTGLKVCHRKRIRSNRVFLGIAKLGKNTKGWFFGFKLHVVINEVGQIIATKLTRGNVDDRVPVPGLVKNLTGLLFGDKGYIKASLFEQLHVNGLKLVTGIKKNMKNHLMPELEKKLLRKRSIIETVFDYLKNKFELEHQRHRSFTNFLVHILSTLISYSMKTKKPSINLHSFLV